MSDLGEPRTTHNPKNQYTVTVTHAKPSVQKLHGQRRIMCSRSIPSMRLLVLFVTAVMALSVAACGGEDAAPLALEQRVSGEADAPGSQADPVETPITIAGIEDARSLPELLFTPEEEDVTAMEEAGFVSGLVDTRFFPSEPGAEHVGDEAHVATLVMHFASEE
ncbi:MAG TPA: hypothetical protein VHM29_10730, partial [Acidimicrobiia bacterium]|nr:hypothetical protein [Acidimicrobiia bacterium]